MNPLDPAKWTAKEMLETVCKYLCPNMTTANLLEFNLEPHRDDEKWGRRADMLSIFCGGMSKGWATICASNHGYIPSGYRVGFEVKTSLADLKVDQKDKYKQVPLHSVSNELYFVTPVGMITKPEGHNWYPDLGFATGLIEVYRDDRTRWLGAPRIKVTLPAPIHANPDTPQWLVENLVRRTLYGQRSSGETAMKPNPHYLEMMKIVNGQVTA